MGEEATRDRRRIALEQAKRPARRKETRSREDEAR